MDNMILQPMYGRCEKNRCRAPTYMIQLVIVPTELRTRQRDHWMNHQFINEGRSWRVQSLLSAGTFECFFKYADPTLVIAVAHCFRFITERLPTRMSQVNPGGL